MQRLLPGSVTMSSAPNSPAPPPHDGGAPPRAASPPQGATPSHGAPLPPPTATDKVT
jgi:hypothetical protein